MIEWYYVANGLILYTYVLSTDYEEFLKWLTEVIATVKMLPNFRTELPHLQEQEKKLKVCKKNNIFPGLL